MIPNLLLELPITKRQIKLNPDSVGPAGGELYMGNEQPFDFNLRPMAGDGGQQHMLAVEPPQMTRDERTSGSSGGAAGPAIGQNYKSNKSLAMRALNADRLLQHLAAGGSPPILSYGSLA